MKYRWDKKYLYWGVTAICVIVVSLLVFAAIFEFKGVLSVIGFIFRILSPVLYGFAIAYLLTPLVNKLDRIQMKTYFKNAKKPHKAQKAARAISVVASVLLLLGILIGLCMMLIPQLITNILGFYQNIESHFYNLEDWINGLVGQNSSFAEYANQFLGQAKQMIVGWMSADLVPQLQNILVNVTSTLWSVFSVFADLIIGMIIAIYFLYSKEKFAAQGKKVTYALFSHHNGDIIVKNARYAHRVFGGFITGKIIDSAIVGGLCFIAMTIFQFPYPPLISVIIGVANVIPFFGPYIGAIPSILLILLVDPLQALYFLIFILVLQQIEGNIIAPKVLGEATGLTGFWVIFAIVVFGGTMGFVGLIIGVPAFAVIYTWIKNWITRRLQKKHMPTETVAYSMQGCFRPMTEEEKIAVDKMESERAEEAFRKATKQTLSQRIKKWWKNRKYK